MNLPDWYHQAKAEGRISDKGVNHSAFTGDVRNETSIPSSIVETYLVGIGENEFQKIVMQEAWNHGLRVAHFRKVRIKRADGKEYWETPVAGDAKGFLDLEIVGRKLIKVELKVGRNKPTPEQREWIDSYRRAGIPAFVWYPKDWQAIVATFKEIA